MGCFSSRFGGLQDNAMQAMVQPIESILDAFSSYYQDSKNQTTLCEPRTQTLADHVLVCGIMWQIEPVSYVFHQPTQ